MRRRSAWVLLGVAAALLACGHACAPGARPPSRTAPPARPVLRLVAVTDLSGYLQPCGCQSRPLGGIDKAAALLRAWQADAVPVLFVSAGNLFFADDSADPKLDGGDAVAAQQAQWQAQTLARILGGMSLAAAVPGPADLARGDAELMDLQRAGGFRWLDASSVPARCAAARGAAGAAADGGAAPALGCDTTLLLRRGGVRVGLFGLRAAPSGGPADAIGEARRRTQALRARGAELVVGLWSGDARTARRIAGATAGLDFLLVGGIDRAEPVAPERMGTTTLLRAAHRGHGLLSVDIFRSGPGALADASAWTRAEQREQLRRHVAELQARIDDWQRQPNVERALLAGQQARLASLRRELAALAAPPRPSGNAFSARFVELAPELAGDPQARALIDAHERRVNEHNRVALAQVLPMPVAPGAPAYVGSARCGQCHTQALAWWQGHAHGRAYATLEQRNAQFNLSCVGCHVTGYNRPGGSTAVHNQGLLGVGCESCHGPGSLHAEDPDVEANQNVHRDVPESVCTTCHNAEHSDRFDYATYRARLLVPGHGLARAGAAP